MKTLVFELLYPADARDRYEEKVLIFIIPLLLAYAIEFTEFFVPNQLERIQKRLIEGQDYLIADGKLIWNTFETPMFVQDPVYIQSPFTIIHPEGIRGVFRPAEIDEILQLTEQLAA